MEENFSTPVPAESPTDPSPASTPKRFPLGVWVGLILAAFALGMGASYLLFARPLEARAAAAEQKLAILENAGGANPTTQTGDQNQVNVPEQVKRYDVPTAGSQATGSETAPITLIEFSDYECPFCQQWHQQVLPKIQAQYGDKIRFVYRNFPLSSIHPNATAAAEAAACAGEQKKYFEFGDLLFGGGKPLGSTAYEDYAQQLGLNTADFKQCVAARRYQKLVEDDVNFASQLGVRSTPTFFVNGLAIVGAQPYEVFQQVIDLELAGKIPK